MGNAVSPNLVKFPLINATSSRSRAPQQLLTWQNHVYFISLLLIQKLQYINVGPHRVSIVYNVESFIKVLRDGHIWYIIV